MSDKEIAGIIGKNISDLIISRGITQRSLADALEVEESTVGKWVQGKNAPRMAIIQKISDIYGIEKSRLVCDMSGMDAEHSKVLELVIAKIKKATPEQLDQLNKIMDVLEERQSNIIESKER